MHSKTLPDDIVYIFSETVLKFWRFIGPGHSFEARIYAENVPRGFLPAAGMLHHYSPPETSSTGTVKALKM